MNILMRTGLFNSKGTGQMIGAIIHLCYLSTGSTVRRAKSVIVRAGRKCRGRFIGGWEGH